MKKTIKGIVESLAENEHFAPMSNEWADAQSVERSLQRKITKLETAIAEKEDAVKELQTANARLYSKIPQDDIPAGTSTPAAPAPNWKDVVLKNWDA